jgi:drug/metabolite transporter (DMT)-like permease
MQVKSMARLPPDYIQKSSAADAPSKDTKATNVNAPHKSEAQTGPKEDGQHRFTMCGLSPVFTAIVASLAWMGVSSGLIMLNKDLLSTGFPYPMALSGTGVAFTALASYISCHRLKLVEAKRQISVSYYLTRIMPVGLLTALTLGCGNLVYMYLTVSFIQILKSLTPVMTMIALFLARLETPTPRLIVSVSVIAGGTALASIGEVNFSTVGILIMFASEATEAIRLVMTQSLLTGLQFHPSK